MTDENKTLAEEIALQVGQQVAQSISQSNDAMMAKLSTILSGQTVKAGSETVFSDVGLDEFSKTTIANMMNNAKRTYDEYQGVSLDGVGKNRNHFDKMITDLQEADNRKRNIADQALQNAVETANMVSKQAVRHSDLAIDRQWNVDEVAGFFQKIMAGITDPNVAAAMATSIASAMLDNKN